MKSAIDGCAWPAARLGEALDELGRESGLAARSAPPPVPPPVIAGNDEALSRWIEAAGAAMGLEAEPVAIRHADLEAFAAGPGPALARLPGAGPARFLALLGGSRGKVLLVTPDLRRRRLDAADVRRALAHHLESPLGVEAESLLAEAGVSSRRRRAAARAIVRERLRPRDITGLWLVALTPGAPLGIQARRARLPARLATMVGAHLAHYGLWLAAWWMVGAAAFGGHLDRAWLTAWALVLLTLVPFQILTTWSAGLFSIAAGGLIKQRLLHGALRLKPEEVRRHGAGALLGQVIESEALESMAINGGFLGLLALVELASAFLVLALGAGRLLLPLLLAAWIAVTLVLAFRNWRHRSGWTQARLDLTTDLVERMVGHRTRLAQETFAHRHDGEDQILERYLELSRAFDRSAVRVSVVVPRGWLLLGVLGLAPAFLGGASEPSALAIGLGGVLLAHQAFARLAGALVALAAAGAAWQQTAPLFRAASREVEHGSPEFAAARPIDPEANVIEAHDVVFRYRDRGEPVLAGLDLNVGARDRILLEGPSGGGKSTLASLLVGLRLPDSGLVLLGGLDQRTLGEEGWRRRAVSAPQFHENHVFTATLAFNLLMGRRWPPLPADVAAAEAMCRALDLGPLIERMPAGLLQMVGETGWQLSHGEKSRLYIARALLQGADLVVLDESFAALDPVTLGRTLRFVLDTAPALVVVAHP